MQIYDINKTDKVTTYKKSTYNGPISSSVGVIAGFIFTLIGIVVGIFYLMSYLQYFKTKDYIEIDATIVRKYEKDNIDYWTLNYIVDGKLYTKESILAIGTPDNDKVKIYYNPNDYTDIIWGDRKPDIFILLIALFFGLCGVTTISLNVRRILHFFNPRKYERVDDSVSVGVGTGNFNDLDDLEDIKEGHSKGIRF